MLTAEYADRNRAGSIDSLKGYNEATRFLAICKQISSDSNGYNILHTYTWRIRASI